MKNKILIGFYNYTVIATYAALIFGVFGIYSAMKGDAFMAIVLLLLAGSLDMFDGKIAKTRKRTADEKHFGIQIDSLCDLVNFGVLPTAIGWSLGLRGFGFTVLFALYVLTAQIRLAYFNVDEFNRQNKTTEGRKFYTGLPVTSSALLFPFVYTFSAPFGAETTSVCYGIMLFICAVFFVLNIRIPKPQKKMIIAFAVIGLAMLACLICFRLNGTLA